MELFPDYTALIIFGIVLCLLPLLSRFLFEPVATTMERRAEQSSAAETQFQAVRAEDEEATRMGNDAISAARRSGYREMDRMRRDAARRASERLDAARRKAAETLAAGQAQLDRQVREAEATLERTAAGLGDELVARLLGRTG